ncbi:uncharacterized protein [Engystomops pustulosus]|uniref:uncharacterized protein n=1 Tax=Engystomops pustulosus TaxID=76066 RepID=UPI003AFB42CA
MILRTVLCYLVIGSSAVTIVQDPPVLNIVEGQSAVMSCAVKEGEDLQILYYHWNLNSTDPDHLLENSTRVSIISGTLIIFPVIANDSGLYLCTVLDSKLHGHRGLGTRLLVQCEERTDKKPHYFLYGLFLILLLPISFFCWRFRSVSNPGAQKHDKKKRRRKMRKEEEEEEEDTELHYSTIFPQPKGARTMKETRSREEEVLYAPVKTPASILPQSCPVSDTDGSEVTYATLKTARR